MWPHFGLRGSPILKIKTSRQRNPEAAGFWVRAGQGLGGGVGGVETELLPPSSLLRPEAVCLQRWAEPAAVKWLPTFGTQTAGVLVKPAVFVLRLAGSGRDEARPGVCIC